MFSVLLAGSDSMHRSACDRCLRGRVLSSVGMTLTCVLFLNSCQSEAGAIRRSHLQEAFWWRLRAEPPVSPPKPMLDGTSFNSKSTGHSNRE